MSKKNKNKKNKKNLTYDLVKYPNAKLSRVCKEVDISNLKKLTKIANKLIATCEKFEGLGMSANQAGMNIRMFVADLGEDKLEVIINPQIIYVSKDTIFDIEGCLSLEVQYKVERPYEVKVEYYTLQSGNIIKMLAILQGSPARVFFHEYQHLEGITIKDIGEKVEQ